MRKHFLLLMLMALLPLAGWAADLSTGTLIAPSPYYGDAPAAVSVFNEGGGAVAATQYDVIGYFSDATCETAATVAQIQAANAGTTFYVKVTGKNGYENSLIASFEVKPMPLTVTVTAASKTYLEADPASFVISAVADNNGADVMAALAASITPSRVAGEGAGAYDYTATIAGQPNYVIGAVNNQFTINPKAFTDGTTVDITLTADFTYTGAAQEAAIVVKDKALDATLVKDVDYTVAYATNINAGVNTAAATITGKGNYAATAIVKNYSINAAPLLVTPHAKKVYDGTAAVPAIPANAAAFTDDVYLTFQGFVNDAESAANVTWTTASWASSDGTANVKNAWKLTLTPGDMAIANYTIVPQEGTFEITKKETLTVTASNQGPLEYGTAVGKTYNTHFTFGAGTFVAADEVALGNAIDLAVSAEPNEAGEYTLTPYFMTDAEIDAAYTGAGNAAKRAAAKQARDNYSLLAENITTGVLTYNKATLMVALKESAYTLSKIYDGQNVPEITLDKTAAGLTVVGFKGTDAIGSGLNVDNLTLTVVDNAAAAGLYQLVLSGATAENYNIIYVASQYEIEQRPLNVTIYDQTFKTGALVSSLNQSASMFSVEEGVEDEGLIAGDAAAEVFKLAFSGAVTTTGDPATITNAANVNDGIIVADAGIAGSKWANYDVTYEAGDVIIVAATAITLDDTKDLTTVLVADEAAADVTFSARSLNAEQWNVLVLPFEISVKDLSTAFDYAVVDVLDETKADGNAHFKIQAAGKIAASTPFLIYPSGVKNNLNQVVFNGVDVKKQTSATVEVADAGGNKLIGTYATTPIYGENFWYMSKGTWYDARNYTEASPCNIKPLRGFLQLATAAARIFIENPDGTTTAIEGITGETIMKNVKADGWYTINGMKLNEIPTQKGIYINNGKKVVIK